MKEMVNIVPLIVSSMALNTAARLAQQNTQRIIINKHKREKENKKKNGKQEN